MTTDGQTSPESVASSGASTGEAPAAGNAPAAVTPPAEGTVQVSGAPEAYADFTMPEGFTFADADKEAFVTFAKENNLTQEQAQKLLDRDVGFAETQNKAIEAQVEKWKHEVAADPELGNAENMGVAKEGLERFATAELRQMLSETNLGNHPLVLKHFHALGKLAAQDKFVNAQAPARAPKTLAERLYGSTN